MNTNERTKSLIPALIVVAVCLTVAFIGMVSGREVLTISALVGALMSLIWA